MTLNEAIALVREHNLWRRGGEGKMAKPKDIGIALDMLVEECERLVKEKEVTDIGYRNLMEDYQRSLRTIEAAKKHMEIVAGQDAARLTATYHILNRGAK